MSQNPDILCRYKNLCKISRSRKIHESCFSHFHISNYIHTSVHTSISRAYVCRGYNVTAVKRNQEMQCKFLRCFKRQPHKMVKHSNNSSANCRRIVSVYLTILRGWRLKGNSLNRKTYKHHQNYSKIQVIMILLCRHTCQIFR